MIVKDLRTSKIVKMEDSKKVLQKIQKSLKILKDS